VVACSSGAVTSPPPTTPPVKHKRRHPQLEEPPGGLEEAGEDRLCAIPQLNGDSDVSVCTDPASQPSLPSPSLSSLPPPIGLATVKNKCCICNDNKIFNF
jgi:hypothetical protein